MIQTTPGQQDGGKIAVGLELTFDDNAAMVQASRPGWRRMAHRTVLWALVVLNAAAFVSLVGHDPLAWVCGAIVILLLDWSLVAEPWIVRRHFAKMELGGRPGTITADDEGLKIRIGSLASSVAWEAVRRIERTNRQLFFWISGVQAVIVPRRAFGENEQEERFVPLAKAGTGKNVE